MVRVLIFCISLLNLSSCMVGAVATVGGAALVASEDRTIGQTVDDVSISSKIKSSFVKNGFGKLYARIKVSVSQGRVMYTGTVESDEDMIKAVDIAWSQGGVNEVINHLSVDENSRKFDAAQYAKDAFITAGIKTKMIANKKIKSNNFTIITQSNVVYILGIARSEEESDLVSEISSVIAGVQKVINNAKIISASNDQNEKIEEMRIDIQNTEQ